MNHRRQLQTVAAWEFRRYFKWKDQVVGLAISLAISALWMGAAMVSGAKGGRVTIELAGVELIAPNDSRIRFVQTAADPQARTESLQSGKLQGVLVRAPDGSFELLVAKDPRYKVALLSILEGEVRRERLVETGVSNEDLARLLAPPVLDVRFIDPALERRGRGEKIAAAVFIGILLLAIFTSMAYLLTGICGEKQLRVTESVVSAISPQAWIDGKVAGITGYALASVGNMVLGGLIVALVAQRASGFTLPEAAVRPTVLLALLAYTVLGLLLWNSFFAALAATVDDPNTSSRSSLAMLPTIPVVMSLAVLRAPDAAVSRFLALFPLTSAPALPIRLVLSNPPWWEIALSVALLVAAIVWMRRVAGRIFEIGMLLYGKEPTMREIARWARLQSPSV